METGDLLVEFLGEDVDLSAFVLLVIFGSVVPEFNLSEDLVGERAAHHE